MPQWNCLWLILWDVKTEPQFRFLTKFVSDYLIKTFTNKFKRSDSSHLYLHLLAFPIWDMNIFIVYRFFLRFSYSIDWKVCTLLQHLVLINGRNLNSLKLRGSTTTLFYSGKSAIIALHLMSAEISCPHVSFSTFIYKAYYDFFYPCYKILYCWLMNSTLCSIHLPIFFRSHNGSSCINFD